MSRAALRTVLPFAVATVYYAYHWARSSATGREGTTALHIERAEDPLDTLGAFARRSATDGALLEAAIAPALREGIVSGALPGGTRLSEAQVARRLRVSRTPVRRALNQLEHERLVVIVPHIGASVRTITPEDVEEIYEVRIALEVLAVKLVVERMGAVGRAELNEALNVLRSSADDAEEYAKALDALHLTIMRLARNRTLVQMYENLVGPIRRFRRINLGVKERVQRSLRLNLRIGRAILAGEADAATMMEEHLHKASAEVIAILRSHGAVKGSISV